MKYEAPELIALTSAVKAIQAHSLKNSICPMDGSPLMIVNEHVSAYTDWE